MSTLAASEDTAAVVAAQQAWSDSVLTNDADIIAHQLRSDGVIVTPDGIVTADQFLTAIRASALSHTRMEAAQGRGAEHSRQRRMDHDDIRPHAGTLAGGLDTSHARQLIDGRTPIMVPGVT